MKISITSLNSQPFNKKLLISLATSIGSTHHSTHQSPTHPFKAINNRLNSIRLRMKDWHRKITNLKNYFNKSAKAQSKESPLRN